MGIPEIKIMRERCVLCGDCIVICPQSGKKADSPVLSRSEDDSTVRVSHPEGCIGCYACVEFCRAAAIHVSEEESLLEDQPEIFPGRPVSRIV